jgi:methylated-DNA-protein-cysteine methyltransferase-like protein
MSRAASGAVFARVHQLVAKIPRGRVATYGQLSELIGGRLSALAIGWALRASPQPLPWHRVVNSRGTISTDNQVPGRQRQLLEAEGVEFDVAGVIDLKRFQWRPRATKAGRRHRDV